MQFRQIDKRLGGMLAQRYYSRMTLRRFARFHGLNVLLSARLIIYRVTDHVLPQRGCGGSITWYSGDRIRFVRNKRNCATHETVISISYVTGFGSFRQVPCPPNVCPPHPCHLHSARARPSRPIRPSCSRSLTPPRGSPFLFYIVYCSLLAY